MKQILDLNEAIAVAKKINLQNKNIVLVGGCFDILHIGHFALLEKSKNLGDILMVFLESDEKIKKTKGIKRPLHSIEERARMVSSIKFVNYVVKLPFFKTDNEYKQLVERIKPSIIAITENDPYRKQKNMQAKEIGAKVIEVIPFMPEKSSSNIVKSLLKEEQI